MVPPSTGENALVISERNVANPGSFQSYFFCHYEPALEEDEALYEEVPKQGQGFHSSPSRSPLAVLVAGCGQIRPVEIAGDLR